MQISQSRRDFLAGLSAAGAAAIVWHAGSARRRGAAGDDHDPDRQEHRHLRRAPATSPMTSCARRVSPTSASVPAAGGFTFAQMAGRGEIDFGISFAASVVFHLDAGLPVTALAGVHSGCYELFAHEPIRTISDLKGKRVGTQTLSSSGHLFLAIMAKHVGLDPQRDIDWVAPSVGQRHGAVRRRKSRCVSRRSRPSRRNCAPARSGRVIIDTSSGQAVVAIPLLHAVRQPGVRPRLSGCHQARGACHPQGRRLLRGRPRERPHSGWSMADSRSDMTMRSRR